MENEIIRTTNHRGDITEYRELNDGKWIFRVNQENWFGLNTLPPEEVLQKARRKGIIKSHPEPSISLNPEPTKKVVPIRKNQKSIGLSGYKSFFIGNSEWYGNKFFASLPPSGPWIIQYVISQIIRDTSRSHEFPNSEILLELSDKYYLWSNLSIPNIVEKTGASKNTVMRVMKIAEKSGCILSVPGIKKHFENNIYVCGVKNYQNYSQDIEKQEWLFVDCKFARDSGSIPKGIMSKFQRGLHNKKVVVDGKKIQRELFC